MNQPGKDPQIGQDLRRLYDNTLPSGTILISMNQAAMTMALQIFDENIHTTGMDTSGGMSLKCRMKEPSGKFIWARIIPEFWNEIVKDSYQLRLASKASESRAQVSSVIGTLTSRERTKVMGIAKFNIPPDKTVRLYMRTKNNTETGTVKEWTLIDPNIGAGWPALLNEAKDQYSTVEIFVEDLGGRVTPLTRTANPNLGR
ncbi:hypothetical protein GALMADRAFT_216601 [Galerina marginata CBS 339.88]|uniref:Uncharacterized protein n=1 Tax=Galerina marginata (strain CBS 339.88) TaxID=685588 RepID=A0A067SK02_GALM3|nr:hypothetical protein GALMADRAFT_216601 [Galerina marginata CBS 339.88]